jgi:hypothetical protein
VCQLLKMLAVLNKCEPGRGWLGENLRWSRLEPLVPGWQFTAAWYNEDGMPKRGKLVRAVKALTHSIGRGVALLLPAAESVGSAWCVWVGRDRVAPVLQRGGHWAAGLPPPPRHPHRPLRPHRRSGNTHSGGDDRGRPRLTRPDLTW